LLLAFVLFPAGPLAAQQKSLQQTFAELLPGMGAADPGARNAPQQAWQKICFEASAPGKEAMRLEVCKLMSEKLGEKTPNPARVWLLQQLQRIGAEECVEQVAAAARDKDVQVHEEAIRCLAANPSRKATAQLIGLLDSAGEPARVGILNALGHRKDPQAVKAITTELSRKDSAAVQAAARALGRIAGADAAAALAAARAAAPKQTLPAINDAYLRCADQMLKAGKHKDALAIYTELNQAKEPTATRLAALQGMLHASGDQAGSMILELLRGDDTAARAIAIGHIENLSAGALKPLAQQLGKLPTSSQVMVLTAIAARGDRSLLPTAVDAAGSDNDAIRKAGIQALGKLGDASVVPLLLGLIAKKSAVSALAADSLAQVPGEEVTQKLIAALKQEKDQPGVLIGILQRRKAASAVPALLEIASQDSPARNSAFAALRDLAEPKQVPDMVLAILKMKGKDRDQAEQAIVAICGQIAEPEKRAEPVLTVYDESTKEQKVSLLPLLGKLGGAESLKHIRHVLAAGKEGSFDVALTALCQWPDPSVSDELLAYARDTSEPRRVQALHALIRVNALLSDRPVLARLDSLKKAMDLAQKDSDRRLALEAMGNVKHIDTLRHVMGYLDDKSLSQSACKAVVELAHSKMLREPNRAEFHKALDRVIAICKDKGLIERAKDYKQQP
jgi:HEAT repeat protein